MEQFRMKAGAYQEIRKIWLLRKLPLTLVALCGGALLAVIVQDGDQNRGSVFFITLLFFGLIFSIATYQALRRDQEICKDFLLCIDQHTITRTQFDSDPITFAFDQVREIYKRSDGSVVIMRESIDDAIIVPKQIDDHQKLEAILSRIMPLSDMTKQPLTQRYSAHFIGLSIVLFILMGSSEKIIIISSGVILLGLIGFDYFVTHNSVYVHKRNRSILPAIFLAYIVLKVMYSYPGA